MQQKVLHLFTVRRWALRVLAGGGVLEKGHVQLDGSLPLSPLLRRQLRTRFGRDLGPLEPVGVCRPYQSEALAAEVVVHALRAVVTDPTVHLAPAVRTGGQKLRHVRVMYVVERHHRGVLSPAEGVELVVVPLA